jgi:hypothetical protein
MTTRSFLLSTPDRREFLRSGIRYALLAGLAALGAALAARRGAVQSSNDCAQIPLCRDCALFANCKLPRAVDARTLPRRS